MPKRTIALDDTRVSKRVTTPEDIECRRLSGIIDVLLGDILCMDITWLIASYMFILKSKLLYTIRLSFSPQHMCFGASEQELYVCGVGINKYNTIDGKLDDVALCREYSTMYVDGSDIYTRIANRTVY